MVAFSEHRRWIISVFDQRSIMNRLYWHDQQVGYVCFIPFVWEQRGVIAAVADQTAMISHLLLMCWTTRGRSWGHVMMWALFGSQESIALNWHSRYSGTRYSGTWLYMNNHVFFLNRRIADVCFELHFRVTPGQFRPAAASSLHRRLALLATSTRPSFSKNAYLGILFAPMYQKYSLDFVSFGFYSNIQIV